MFKFISSSPPFFGIKIFQKKILTLPLLAPKQLCHSQSSLIKIIFQILDARNADELPLFKPKAYKNHAIDVKSSTNNLYELEILQTIPTIIKKLRANEIHGTDRKFLKHMFGDLWELIEDESKRAKAESVNPILDALLGELRSIRQITKQTNDIKGNTVETMIQQFHFKANDQIPIRLGKLQQQALPLPQRLLRVAALLIHDSFAKKLADTTETDNHDQRKVQRRKRIHKRHVGDGQLDVDVEQLETSEQSAIERRKRNADYDMYMDDMADEVQMNLLRTMINQSGKKEDDYNYDGEEYDYMESKQEKQQVRSTGQPEAVQRNDYQDYAFDTTNTDPDDEDDLLLRAYYGRSSVNGDYEYESIADLLHLAAKHNLRAQRDSGYLKRLQFKDYLDSDLEY